MPLPIAPVSEAEWDAAPTAHRVLVGDAIAALRDPRPAPPAHHLTARLRRQTRLVSQTMRTREVLGLVFRHHDPVMQASTTKVVADLAEGGPLIHLFAWNGACAVIASYDHDGRNGYAVGRFEGADLLWSDELRTSELREWFDREHHRGSRFAERLDLPRP